MQIEHNTTYLLKIPTGERQTSWLAILQSVAALSSRGQGTLFQFLVHTKK